MPCKSLGDLFAGIAVKRLSEEDLVQGTSGEFEIATTRKMRKDFLGEEDKRKFESTISVMVGESSEAIIDMDRKITHFLVRDEKSSDSEEWRLSFIPDYTEKYYGPDDTLFSQWIVMVA